MKKHHARAASNNKNVWQIQEAKAKFSQLVEDANIKGYKQLLSKASPWLLFYRKKNLMK